ncbi:DUF4240 domain-containing protein [Nocardia sp. NPDC051832]|uniref:DUF4240 domain-containing protein n=1 Tax=Nocardia sp. NPDC051832 TaxID=3155673 RepID=UPI0034288D53
MHTAADESRFWDMIETAWESVGAEPNALRRGLPARKDDAPALDAHLKAFLDQLRSLGDGQSADELTALDRVLERKMYDLDRADLHRVIGGSDDGFLYGRGFIVAMGKDYYDAISATPTTAAPDGECQAMGYFFAQLHNERFGSFPRTGGGITRESASNPTGWA